MGNSVAKHSAQRRVPDQTELFPAKTHYLFRPFTESLVTAPSSTFSRTSAFPFQNVKAKLVY